MNTKVAENKSTGKKVLNIITNIVTVLYILFTVLISVSIFTSMNNGVPSLFGYTFMNVLTDSMETDSEDSIKVGDLAICKKPEDKYALQINDVIAFKTTIINENNVEQEIIKIHRIIDINETGQYITCGDNSPDNDKDGKPDPDAVPVHGTRVIGKYTGKKIPFGGKVYDFITGPTGLFICLVIPMAIFFIWALIKFIKTVIEYKMSKAPEGGLSEEQKQAAIAEYLAKQAKEQGNNDSANAEDKDENN
ncbi:MAG: signal peptidase I [Clostridia bacterium]|nr:signal peptidase I [Clostridia bacterium]